MGARSGNNYLSAMRKLKADVWLGGQRVDDVTQINLAWATSLGNTVSRQ